MKTSFDNDKPIYLQIVDGIETDIVSGILSPGEKLPSVREYALKLKVNPNTMQKALTELENLKLIYTERTNGKYVTTNEKLIKKYKEKFAQEKINKFLNDMKDLGINNREIINYIKDKGSDK